MQDFFFVWSSGLSSGSGHAAMLSAGKQKNVQTWYGFCLVQLSQNFITRTFNETYPQVFGSFGADHESHGQKP